MSKADRRRIERLEDELIKLRSQVLALQVSVTDAPNRVRQIVHDHDIDLLRYITEGKNP